MLWVGGDGIRTSAGTLAQHKMTRLGWRNMMQRSASLAQPRCDENIKQASGRYEKADVPAQWRQGNDLGV